MQQFADRVAVDVRLIANADQFLRQRVDRSQDIVSLAARSTANEQPRRTPHPTQERRQHEMSRIDKQHRPFADLSFGQTRLKLRL